MVFFLYLFQVIVFTGLLAFIYRYLLMPLPIHHFNRRFLVAAIVLPPILPFLFIPDIVMPLTLPDVKVFALPEFIVSKNARTGMIGNFTRWPHLPYYLYFGLSLILMLHLVLKHYQLSKLLKNAPRIVSFGQDVAICPNYGPGSYRNIIFFPSTSINASILQHEQAHIILYHQYDLILLQFLKTIFWANPFLYYLAAQLRLVHEFQADSIAGSKNFSGYTEALLGEVLDTKQHFISHSFFHHPIKKRIIMLQKQQKGKTGFRLFKTVATAAIVLVSATGIIAQTAKHATKKRKHSSAPKEQVFRYVEIMPAFDGDLNTWLAKHINYPEDARENGQAGRVIVEFIVNKTGMIKDVKVKKSSNVPALDKEALRVLSEMPQWKPGNTKGNPVNVYFTLPITFALS